VSDQPATDESSRLYNRIMQREKRQKRLARGVCVYCAKKPPREGFQTCEGCAERWALAAYKYRPKATRQSFNLLKARAEKAEAQLAATHAAHQKLEAEIAEAREACPVVRRQDFFDAPLLTLIEQEVSQLFQMQVRAEKAEAQTAATHAAIRALPRYKWTFTAWDDGAETEVEYVRFDSLARLLGDPAQEQPPC